MAKETEIKLRVSPSDMQRLAAHPLLEQHRCQDWQTRPLLNAYYDTPAHNLAQAQVALRIRQDGEQRIQTLKSKGCSVAGLSERNEWDWIIEGDSLVLAHLDDSCWPASLHDLDKQQLVELFRTDFTRQSVELALSWQDQPVCIEVALDQGLVRTADEDEQICELELELREGPPEALLVLARQLAQDIPLMPCDISKAERGYRLLQADSFELQVNAAILEAEQSAESAFAALMQEKLAASQRLAEQYRHAGHWKLLQQWVAQLVAMRALLSSMGQVVPRKNSHDLRQLLDALLADWQPRLLAGGQSREQRDAMPAAFAGELANTRWGCFSLQLALWLHQQRWGEGRNARAERQAQAPLNRWLARVLQEEAQALGLEAYKLKAYALAEQLPRLERLLVWLDAARQYLTSTLLDDTLGALRQLHQAAHDGEPEATVACLLRLGADKGWKQLVRGTLQTDTTQA